jgi:small conductance mechanosensitive channel
VTSDSLNDLIAKLDGWIDGAVLMLPNLAAAVLIVLGFWIGARLLSNLTARVLRRTTHFDEINRLLSRLVFVAVMATGSFIALGVLQLDKTVTSLIAGAGILTLVAGLAFQDLASNFIAGVLLQLRHPFRIGALVRSNDFYGTVEHINLRATVIRTLTGQRVYIPNRDVFNQPIENFSAYGRRRVDVPVGISYGDDLARARAIAIAAVEEVPGREADHPVELFYEGFGDSSINFVVRFWIPFDEEPDYLAARSEAVQRIKRAFDDQGVTIPFPIRTLDFSRVGGRVLSEELREANSASSLPPGGDAG